jgi:single-strand DNA-binding protein
MFNQIQLIGNLGADPEIRSFQNGGKVANFRLAVTDKWKDRATGERKERTEWIPVAIFGEGLVGVVERYLRKGSKVFVQGEFRTRKWQTQAGEDRYSTECVLQGGGGQLAMLDPPAGDGRGERKREADNGGWQGQAPADIDDDIPFDRG